MSAAPIPMPSWSRRVGSKPPSRCRPPPTSPPPFCDWPEELADLVAGGTWIVEGGHDYDGRRFMPLNLGQVRQAAREIRAREVRDVAVTAMFSPLDPSHEDAVAEILREEISGVSA